MQGGGATILQTGICHAIRRSSRFIEDLNLEWPGGEIDGILGPTALGKVLSLI